MLLFETLHIAAVVLCVKCISVISVLNIKTLKTSKTTTKRLLLAPMDWCPSCALHLDGTAPLLVLFCWFVVSPSIGKVSRLALLLNRLYHLCCKSTWDLCDTQGDYSKCVHFELDSHVRKNSWWTPPCEDRLRELELLSLEKGKLWGHR